MTSQLAKHFDLLGKKVQDRISGVEGIVDSLSFDLYGCIQCAVNQGMKEDGERKPSYWFDVSRIKILSDERVMELPDFAEGAIAEGKHGPADKPMPDRV